MRPVLARFRLVVLSCFGVAIGGCLADPARADQAPFTCTILPGDEIASIAMTNPLASDASCIVTCRFSTTKYDNNPQITCAKSVPSGKEVEMCRLTSGGDKFVKLTGGNADCLGLSNPSSE
ncbi:hypothetical protein [Bradyrhizobium sp. AUGA SZCCT0182]|uniref:hypothetical protein n=1 Tax=Bradyrhizobium sp. AUGA SZCCT0182 TaxID=2807667 RepID=UPI002011F5AC|nr:hypothetical protein [Bradyrhizobium sp. AUGA SZCCT0182]